ncbi:MAG: hypothetical protein ACREOH_15340 [Candidatus Entotheonellia bacterium]
MTQRLTDRPDVQRTNRRLGIILLASLALLYSVAVIGVIVLN